jgi:hypothetical protein
MCLECGVTARRTWVVRAVECPFAWLGNVRRLLMRWEHLSSVYHSFLAVGVMLLCVRRLLRRL